MKGIDTMERKADIGQQLKETKEMLNALGVMNKDIPTTGVFSMNRLEYYDDIDQGIDESFETYCKFECELDAETCEDCHYESMGDSTILIGFVWNEETQLYDIDEKAEYSAIVNCGSNTIQVVKSVWALRGGMCSLCYPGQVDADSETDDYLAYSLPPSMISDISSDGLNEVSSRVFLLRHRELLESLTWPNAKIANPDDYAKGNTNYYRVALDRTYSVIVAADNENDALDIAIDYAYYEKDYKGLFLSPEDVEEIEEESKRDGINYLDDYWQGGNESLYLADRGCQGVWII